MRKADVKREARVRLTVPFYDLDPAEVVFHGNYFKYFERARQALFDAAGLDLYGTPRHGDCVYPVVRSTVKHIFPLRMRDEFECLARLVEAHNKIVIDFEIRLLPEGKLCARARIEQVAVRVPDMTLQLLIPEDVRRALGAED